MMNCEAVRNYISAWLDRELPPAESEMVRAHLQSCSACQAERQQLDRIHSVFQDALSSQASDIAFEPFWQGVERRISSERRWRVEFQDGLRSFFSGPRLAWGIPVAILLLLGVFALERLMPVRNGELRRSNYAAVELIDAHGFNVALFREAETKTTVIWLFENREGEDESSEEPTQKGSSF